MQSLTLFQANFTDDVVVLATLNPFTASTFPGVGVGLLKFETAVDNFLVAASTFDLDIVISFITLFALSYADLTSLFANNLFEFDALFTSAICFVSLVLFATLQNPFPDHLLTAPKSVPYPQTVYCQRITSPSLGLYCAAP